MTNLTVEQEVWLRACIAAITNTDCRFPCKVATNALCEFRRQFLDSDNKEAVTSSVLKAQLENNKE